MKEITLSCNPWYYCNLRCSFCYLTPDQLGDKQLLSLNDLSDRIDEVQDAGYTVTHVDLYGGEVTLLPKEYLDKLKGLLYSKGITDIVMNTNLTAINAITEDMDYELSVSYDFSAREKSELVFNNMISLNRWFDVLVLASRDVLDNVSIDEIVQSFNLLNNIRAVEVKPYSQNQANAQGVSFAEFEEFVLAIANHPEREFYFENVSQIKYALSGERNSFSDDHLYITPAGHFAVLDFDLMDHEYFKPIRDIPHYLEWCEEEKVRVSANTFCNACEFKGSCLSEHLREVKSLEQSCNGFHNLLKRCQHESPAPATPGDHS